MLFNRLRRLKKSTPEQDKAFREALEKEGLDWKDRLALAAASFLTLFLPSVLLLLLLSLAVLALFGQL